MAGSYGHIVNDDGQFDGVSLLENGGDVFEAVEEMYGMIWWLAARLGNETQTPIAQLVAEARAFWKRGYEFSPGRGDGA